MRTVKRCFKVLLAEKELRENRSIRRRTIVEASNVSTSTIVRLANKTIKHPPLDRLAALCTYLDCHVGDVLKMEAAPEVGA